MKKYLNILYIAFIVFSLGFGAQTVSAQGCPFVPQKGDILVSFGDVKLRSDLGLDRAQQTVNLWIPGQYYSIKLASYDSYNGRSSITQPNEKYYLKFVNSQGTVLAKSNSTQDLADRITSASWSGTVNNSLYIPSGVTKIIAFHSVYPDTSSPNSLLPNCALLSPIKPAPKPTCSMSASPVSIKEGGRATLSWNSTNAVSVIIDQGVGRVSQSGSKIVSPTTDTTYTGTFTSTGGVVVCKATVTVVPPVSPKPTCSMDINPGSIDKGGNSTLSWSSSNVTSVLINQGIGSVSSSGSKTISPDVDTTYTGTFTGPGGTKTCIANIVVDEPNKPSVPTCSMSSNPGSVTKGESSTISWNSTNVTSVSINQGVGDVSTSGSTSVSPDVNTKYTGTFTGPGGSVVCDTSVNITEVPDEKEPTCSLGISPSVLSPGQHATLYWSSTNVSTTTINNGIGQVNKSGAISISPSHNMSYTGTFEGENKTVTCSATVTLGGGGVNPPTVSLSSNSFETEPSYIYLSQIPYTGVPEFVIYLFRIIFFGGLLYAYYRIDGRSWRVKSE